MIKISSGNSSKLSCKMYNLQSNHNIFKKKIFISSVLKNKHIEVAHFFFTFNRVKMSQWFYLMWHKFDDVWWNNTDQNIKQSGDWLMCYFTICTLKVFFFYTYHLAWSYVLIILTFLRYYYDSHPLPSYAPTVRHSRQ